MSAQTEVDICNIALGRVSVDQTIASMNERTKEGRNCGRFFELCRDEVLERAPWPFAVAVQALAPLPQSELVPGWSYQYAHPTDAVQILEVVPAGEVDTALGYYSNCACDAPWNPCRSARYPFRRARAADGSMGAILSNLNDAWAVYVARVTDTTQWSAMFASTVAWRLAMELAMPMTGRLDILGMATQAYNAMFVDTATRQFEQEVAAPRGDAPAIQARY